MEEIMPRYKSNGISLRRLGGTDIEITPIGLGVWQFAGGKGMAGKVWSALTADISNEIVKA